MNKTPDQMKINDALDLFEELKAKIVFRGGRCNIDEQLGKVMRQRKLYSPTTDEDKKLAAQVGKASELIYERLRDKTKKQELMQLLELREQYRPNNGDTSRRETAGGNQQRREDGTRANQQRRDEHRTSGNTQNSQKNTHSTTVEYVRRRGERGEGNTVKVIEITQGKGITIPLKEGGKIRFDPPSVTPVAIEQLRYRAKGYNIPDVKRYLIIEVTPDGKTKFFNIVYGNLDLEQMKSNSRYLQLCMTRILERKRINDVCRNSFCALDDLVLDTNRNITTAPNQGTVFLAAQALITTADEIRTKKKTTFIDSLFGNNNSRQEEENVLRIFKTGTIMMNGKECLIYSYAVKDETVDMSERVLPEIGCFIVSGFDEERFRNDINYREKVILNVFTPSRLKNTRRADIAYPYIGSVMADGDFENDFDLYNAFSNMDKTR